MAIDPVENSTENKELTDSQTETTEQKENVQEQAEKAESVENTPETVDNQSSSDTVSEDKTVENTSQENETEKNEVSDSQSSDNQSSDDSSKKEEKQEATTSKLDEIFEQLKTVKQNDGTIEVEVHSRIRGGLRVIYDLMPMFLPASHYDIERNPSDKELNDVVGKKLNVRIHEMEEDETGRKTVIVSRKAIIESEVWDKLNVGDEVEGIVSSIAPFGVFLDIGGVEGLIHISRLAPVHVDDPKKFVKKGEKLKVKIVDIDKAKNRIALSHQEYAPSPWDGITEDFPEGTIFKGKVRRLTGFGAYVELKPGVDGLLRTSELSWTKRIKKPADIIQNGQDIEVKIIEINEDKQIAALSVKRLSENPWINLAEKYPEGSVLKGQVAQILEKGCVVTVSNDIEIDGFMPKSKARPIMKANKLPFEVGQEIEVTVVDIVADDESLIIAPKMDEDVVEEFEKSQKNRQNRQNRPQGRRQQQQHNKVEPTAQASSSSFSLGDLLSDKSKDKLKKMGN